MPVLSRLAYIDEGTTSLDPVLLEQDCDRTLKIAVDPDVRAILRDLQNGAAAAVQTGGIIDIYPRVAACALDSGCLIAAPKMPRYGP